MFGGINSSEGKSHDFSAISALRVCTGQGDDVTDSKFRSSGTPICSFARKKTLQWDTCSISKQFICFENTKPGRLIFPRSQALTCSWCFPHLVIAKE